MIRECSLEDISDGRRYGVNDMVKLDTCDCEGCHKCCTNVGNTIVLDPYDIYNLEAVTGADFQKLLEQGYIEMNMVDGLILPNIRMNEKNQCSFLSESGRCSIHGSRPGICRLFPLGRIYSEGGFDYFLQKDECAKELRTKVKIKKWIGISNIEKYQCFVLAWHNFIKEVGGLVIDYQRSGHDDKINKIAMYVLNTFYVVKPDCTTNDVFDILNEKIEQSRKIIFK